MGLCAAGPLVEVSSRNQDAPVMYQHVKGEDAGELMDSLGALRSIDCVVRPTCRSSPASRRSCWRTPVSSIRRTSISTLRPTAIWRSSPP